MSSNKRKCTKHAGMTVSFAASENENEVKCPVCLKDEKISELELSERFLALYFYFGMDWVRVSLYHGLDRAERERTIEKVFSDISNPGVDLKRTVEILAEYYRTRKNYSWSE
jgi:hypothetical protein